ncbi:MAG TPA: PilZ domain-containing protein [Tepidisphaeraceae bacterium]|jgi:hypothetical protein
MKAFPPGFPFVSRTPEPAPEPEAVASEDPVAEAAPESSSVLEPARGTEAHASCEPAPAQDAAPDPEPAPEREPWPFRRRDPEATPAAESPSPAAAAREPWPFRRREPSPAPPVDPVAEEPAVPADDSAAELIPAPLKIGPQARPSSKAPSPQQPERTERTAMAAAAPAKPAKPVVTHERRKVKRDPMATAALLRVDGRHGPPIKIELTDISIAGARFRAPQKLDVGEKAQIRLEIGPFRWTTRLRVVHCSPTDDGATTIGCAFLRTELLRPWPAAA